MVIDAVGRFTKRHDVAATQRSTNAKNALMFLASKSPQMKELLGGLARLEQTKRHGTKT